MRRNPRIATTTAVILFLLATLAVLDGEFSAGDLVHVLAAGKYETHEHAGWAEGDWNGDGVLDTADLMTVREDGGYELGPREDVVVVPEPTRVTLLILGALTPFYRRREKLRRRESARS